MGHLITTTVQVISTMLHHSPVKKANGDIIIESSASKILLPDDGYCKKIKIANK